MAQALLLPREVRDDETLWRKVEIHDKKDSFFEVKVGWPENGGIRLLDDVQVAKSVVKTLASHGYRVVGNPMLPKYSSATKEEATVMTGAFTIERL